ncbi:unnamed protein product, partial [Prorocentrum cordatum]
VKYKTSKAAAAEDESMSVDEGSAKKNTARITGLRSQIDGLKKFPDSTGVFASMRASLVKELNECRARLLDAKPLHIQIERITQLIVDFVDLEAQRTQVAACFPQPATVVDGAVASLDAVPRSARASTAQPEHVAGSSGANKGLAREL